MEEQQGSGRRASGRHSAPGRIGVLALQGDSVEHLAILRDLGAEATSVRDGRDLRGLDGLVLPGGESTTIQMLLESSGMWSELALLIASGLPVFGTCAGMILLASRVMDGRSDQRTFDAIDLSVRRNGFGRQVASFESDLEVEGIAGGPIRAVFIRAPLIESVGPGVEVMASVAEPVAARRGPLASEQRSGGNASDLRTDGRAPAGSRVAARVPVLCRSGPILVSSFHPELTGDSRLHGYFLDMVARGYPLVATEAGSEADKQRSA